ncbi:ADP-ribosylglycohydrolase family protein [Saccharothrix sp. Mg75]|uniref:ADP-ribosylglycohydrolase family protein n=1 Tax=Saccharothrix sp. Mg75 TaxID=3445357 RepID=UPI003EE82905
MRPPSRVRAGRGGGAAPGPGRFTKLAADDYRAAVTACVAAGGDADTTAAITGGVVRAPVPGEWLSRREPLPTSAPRADLRALSGPCHPIGGRHGPGTLSRGGTAWCPTTRSGRSGGRRRAPSSGSARCR